MLQSKTICYDFIVRKNLLRHCRRNLLSGYCRVSLDLVLEFPATHFIIIRYLIIKYRLKQYKRIDKIIYIRCTTFIIQRLNLLNNDIELSVALSQKEMDQNLVY